MDTHNFPNDQKVRRFCLTLTSKVRLWYETIRNANLDWPTMQEHSRQQYSKFGIQENSISTFGDPFSLMKLQTP